MYNPSIPAMTYIDIPNYKTLRENAKAIPVASNNMYVPRFDVPVGQEGLQYDQTQGHAILMKERKAAMTVKDYKSGNFVTVAPHQSELRKSILDTLRFTKPITVYESIISDARTLPKIEFLEQFISPIYSRLLLNNLVNIYNFSPAFYATNITSSEYNLRMYEKFMYLLTYIINILEHYHEEDFMKKDDRLINVVQWCLTRKIQDIDFMIRGPQSPQNYNVDFIGIYNSIISPSADKTSITDYLTLATLQEVNANFLCYRDEFVKHPNVYDKNPNYAQSYTISIDTDENAYFKKDNIGNLIVDCSEINIGSSTNKDINLKIDDAVVDTSDLRYEPRSQAIKFGNILRQFSIFRIQSLLILKSTYKTSLKNYDTCYITFPNITVDGRFNQVYRSGVLQVAGKFQENNNNKYWEFVPYNDIIYVPKTANVKRFEFYVSPKPGSSNKPNPFNFKIAPDLNKCFNVPVRVHTIEELNNTPLAPSEEYLPETYIIRTFKIDKDNGNPFKTKYTFLYNRTYNTLQCLRGQIDISNVPKFGIRKNMKTLKIDVGMMEPKYPATYIYISEVIDIANKKGTTKYRLPKIVPLTNIQALTHMMYQAVLKGQNYITIDYSIDSYRIPLPETLTNTLKKNVEAGLNSVLTYIYKTTGRRIIKKDDSFENSSNNENEDKNENIIYYEDIINKINDALVNKKDYIYFAFSKHYTFDIYEEITPSDSSSSSTYRLMNPHTLLQKINSDEYDYSEALKITLTPSEQIFTTEYINYKINEAIDNKWDKIDVYGKKYDYFLLYLETGENIDPKLLNQEDTEKLYSSLKNNQKHFKSDILNVINNSSSTTYITIRYIPSSTISSSITVIPENYVISQILNNVDTEGNILPYISKFNIPEISENKGITISEPLKTYYINKKEYIDSSNNDKYMNYIKSREKYFTITISKNYSNQKEIKEYYYIEYYTDLINHLIINDAIELKTGKINVDGKIYKYVDCEGMNENDKNKMFAAICSGLNYYYTTSENNQNINNNTNNLNTNNNNQNINNKIIFTTYIEDIITNTAKIWHTVSTTDDIKFKPEEANNGFKIVDNDVYFINLLSSDITNYLNTISNIEFSNDDIIEECNKALQNNNPSFRGIKFLNISHLFNTNDIIKDMNTQGYKYYDMNDSEKTLLYNHLYTSSTGQTVPYSIKTPQQLRYEYAVQNGNVRKYILDVEAKLSNEFIEAQGRYQAYKDSNQTNIIETTTDLPNILPTDTSEDIYIKWSNYYSYYGLFIPDFNYVISYDALNTIEAEVYKGNAQLDKRNYSLFDWVAPIYEVKNNEIIRSYREVDAINIPIIKTENDEAKIEGFINLENIDITIDDENIIKTMNYKLMFENNNISSKEIQIETETYNVYYKIDDDNYFNISIEQIDEKNIYKFIFYHCKNRTSETEEWEILTDSIKTVYPVELPSNSYISYTYYNPNTENENETYIIPSDIENEDLNKYKDEKYKYVHIGIDSSVNISQTKINDTDIIDLSYSDIANLANNVINGTYNKNITNDNVFDKPLTSDDFIEDNTKTNDSSENNITITYKIVNDYTNSDGTTTHTETDMEVEYPNNLSVLHDMNAGEGHINDIVCYRNFNIENNIYKTFIIGVDLFDKNYTFSVNNWLYSLNKLTSNEIKTSPYISPIDLQFSMLSNSNKTADFSKYNQPVLIKYFIQHINNNIMKLIIQENEYGFSGMEGIIDGKRYTLQKLTNNLFRLNYDKVIDNILEIRSSGSRFKMIIKLM